MKQYCHICKEKQPVRGYAGDKDPHCMVCGSKMNLNYPDYLYVKAFNTLYSCETLDQLNVAGYWISLAIPYLTRERYFKLVEMRKIIKDRMRKEVNK